MRRPRCLAGLLVALLVSLALGGCEKSRDDAASSSSSSSSSSESAATGGGEQAAGSSSQAPATAANDGALLEVLAAAGYTAADDVPFDDDGALPDAVANGELEGMTGSRTHVLRRTADGVYVQLFVAAFESPEAATAAATAHPDAVRVADRLVWVLGFGDDPALVDAVRGILRGAK